MTIINEDCVGKKTTLNFGGDLRMSQPWRSYKDDEVFEIVRKLKSGLYLIRDNKGKEHPIPKRHINFFYQ